MLLFLCTELIKSLRASQIHFIYYGIWIWWKFLKSIGVGLWRFILFNFCLILTTTHFPFHFLLLFSLKYFVSHRRGRTSAARLDPPQCLCPPFPTPINSLYCHFSSTLTNSGSSRWKSIIAAPAQIIKCWPSLLSLCFVAVIDNVFLFGECVHTSTMFIFGRSNDELVKETFFRFAGDWIRTCDFISLSAAEDFFKELAFWEIYILTSQFKL